MKPETVEWVAKADADLATAKREAAVVGGEFRGQHM